MWKNWRMFGAFYNGGTEFFERAKLWQESQTLPTVEADGTSKSLLPCILIYTTAYFQFNHKRHKENKSKKLKFNHLFCALLILLWFKNHFVQ